jgi:FkbH-like protein
MPMKKKCIVWDLDNTLWDGICLEREVTIRPEIREVIELLDSRGIIHSIASKNEEAVAKKVLQDQQMIDYFIAPKINWLPKSTNIIATTKALNIAQDAVAFVDDDPFELDQIQFMLPDVMTINSEDATKLPDMPEFNPGVLTRESKSRRKFYQAEEKRKEAEYQYSTREEFLVSCNMNLSIRPMNQDDVQRVSELMTRTHQLNTTGKIFNKDKLFEMSKQKSKEEIFVAELTDKYGWSGIIGTAIVGYTDVYFRIIYFAMSCRILGRGLERAFMAPLVKNARQRGYNEIEALYKETGKNSMMRALYQMVGFKCEKYIADQTMLFKLSCNQIPQIPRWVEVSCKFC